MRTVPASEMKNRLGAYIEAAQAEPVVVERSGRPSVVLLSIAEFERLKTLEVRQLAEPEAGYQAMAADQSRESEALEWTSAARRPGTLSLNGALLRQAKELNLDSARIAEQALESEIRSRRAQNWLEENRQAIADFNAHIERDGVFSDGLRSF